MTRPAALSDPAPPACHLLALDAATEAVHVGLQTPSMRLVRCLPGGAQASSALLPALQALLHEAGLPLQRLDALACGIGPGAFTGLRTACSVVQGLAVGVGRPVLAIPTLLAVAEGARQQGAVGAVWALQDARMGELYVALYEPGEQGWQARVAPTLRTPEQFLAEAARHPDAAWAGNGLKAHASLAAAASHPFPDAAPDGAALLALGNAAWQRSEATDPARLLPLYVRDKVALTTAERSGP